MISDEAREMVEAIINAYHTTRMRDVPAADHILTKPSVIAAVDRFAAAIRSAKP
jgi:hypothetical protein